MAARNRDGYPKASSTAKRKTVVHRINQHGTNGSTSTEVAPEKVNIDEAMRRAVEALGEQKVDQNLAPTQMLELADCFEQVTRMQAAFDARSEEAKTAKKSLESATNLLLEKVRSFTHPAPLPLFDGQQREADQQRMESAANTCVVCRGASSGKPYRFSGGDSAPVCADCREAITRREVGICRRDDGSLSVTDGRRAN